MSPSRSAARFAFPVLLLALLAPPAAAQAVVKVSDDVHFKLGFQVQGWADWSRSATTGGWAQNLFLRRLRVILGGQLAKNVTFVFETDSPDLGRSKGGVKTVSSGFEIQDALLSYRFDDALTLELGHFLVPLSRNILQSTASYLTLDISATSTVMVAPTQTNLLRDNGFQARGYLLDGGRLEYRLAAMQGARDAGSQNAFRTAGYLQYNLFETEKGYVFAGTYLGKKKVLAASAGFDVQKDYRAFSGDVFAALPVGAGDEVGGQVQFLRYDGGEFLPAIPRQDDLLVEAGWYVASAKLQPFAKYERQSHARAADFSRDVERFGLGLNYYHAGQSLKLTVQLLRVEPKSPSLKATSQLTLQVQAFYF